MATINTSNTTIQETGKASVADTKIFPSAPEVTIVAHNGGTTTVQEAGKASTTQQVISSAASKV